MATFTIDSENNIAAHAGVPAGADNLQTFATEEGAGEPQCGVAGLATGRDLGHFSRRGPVRRVRAGEETHQSCVAGGSHSESGSARRSGSASSPKTLTRCSSASGRAGRHSLFGLHLPARPRLLCNHLLELVSVPFSTECAKPAVLTLRRRQVNVLPRWDSNQRLCLLRPDAQSFPPADDMTRNDAPGRVRAMLQCGSTVERITPTGPCPISPRYSDANSTVAFTVVFRYTSTDEPPYAGEHATVRRVPTRASGVAPDTRWRRTPQGLPEVPA